MAADAVAAVAAAVAAVAAIDAVHVAVAAVAAVAAAALMLIYHVPIVGILIEYAVAVWLWVPSEHWACSARGRQ